MVNPSNQHRTATVSKLGRELGRLGHGFDRLAAQQTKLAKSRKSEAEAQIGSLRKGVQHLQGRIAELQEAGRWRKEHFNLFAVIERTHYEHDHSNVLAWLLNPAEAHGLNDAFLKAFVKAVFDEDLGSTTGLVVKREYKHCDIVVWRRADWVLVIENKVDSTQGKGQLKKYAQYWRKRFPKRYMVFLTPTGERPKCPVFVKVSYDAVRRVLMNLPTNEEAGVFIRHFVDHIWFA